MTKPQELTPEVWRFATRARIVGMYFQIGLLFFVLYNATRDGEPGWANALVFALAIRDIAYVLRRWVFTAEERQAPLLWWCLFLATDTGVILLVLPWLAPGFLGRNHVLALMALPFALAVTLKTTSWKAYLALVVPVAFCAASYVWTPTASGWAGTWAQLALGVLTVVMGWHLMRRAVRQLAEQRVEFGEASASLFNRVDRILAGVPAIARPTPTGANRPAHAATSPALITVFQLRAYLWRRLDANGRQFRVAASRTFGDTQLTVAAAIGIGDVLSQTPWSDFGSVVTMGDVLPERGALILTCTIDPPPRAESVQVFANTGVVTISADGRSVRIKLPKPMAPGSAHV